MGRPSSTSRTFVKLNENSSGRLKKEVFGASSEAKGVALRVPILADVLRELQRDASGDLVEMLIVIGAATGVVRRVAGGKGRNDGRASLQVEAFGNSGDSRNHLALQVTPAVTPRVFILVLLDLVPSQGELFQRLKIRVLILRRLGAVLSFVVSAKFVPYGNH